MESDGDRGNRRRRADMEDIGLVADLRETRTGEGQEQEVVDTMRRMGKQVTMTSQEQGTDMAAEFIRNQVAQGKGYVHCLGKEGMTSQLKWAVEQGGDVYHLRWRRREWITNAPEILQELWKIRKTRKKQ